ncbi:hypothetical protein HS088_TW01G00022 [Tripterygium wilfordii]|uniref:Uncharacterized protein n=1 Tax=Tripterygium wilfordii TaxID=458696 RepID=A0A7J7E0H9_TRIWF|nr:hypothetical protein HS088_TW01G00022 [Tripterygium wilfordii]
MFSMLECIPKGVQRTRSHAMLPGMLMNYSICIFNLFLPWASPSEHAFLLRNGQDGLGRVVRNFCSDHLNRRISFFLSLGMRDSHHTNGEVSLAMLVIDSDIPG